MPVISIIVPVYNVEQYLRRCVDSILAQTFTDFECILIDDGSPDNCPAICDEYAERDNRIIVIHQKNAGVSAARNAGLDLARGEWIGFVDSDDWCDPGMYEFLYKNAITNQVDISICGFRSIEKNGVVIGSSKKYPAIVMDSSEGLLKLFSPRYFGPFSWNKLVSKQLFSLGVNKLRYDEKIRFDEDLLLFVHLLKRSKKIYYSYHSYYNSYQRANSVSRTAVAKGMTEASFTSFAAYEEILKISMASKIRVRIFASEGIMAARSCLRYIHANGFKYDVKFMSMKIIVKKNMKYILISGSVKQKIYSCMVFVPFFYKLYCKLSNFIYLRLKRS